MIGRTVSHYEIEEKLGEGGMGVVYRARDARLGRSVALKFLRRGTALDDDAKARFMQEARAASALDHPNVCPVYDIGESESGDLFLVMPCYDGQTLKRSLADGRLPADRVKSVALQVAKGLFEAHRAGIIHRDIKPANLMLTKDGRVVIMDFGVAKLVGSGDLTSDGKTLGTTAYMSPEQARGESIDAGTDFWSLGVVLYEMLSGKKPFSGDYDQAVLYAILNVDPPPLAEADPVLQDIVSGLLQKDPLRRMEAAEKLAKLNEPRSEDRTSGIRSSDAAGTNARWYGGRTMIGLAAIVLVAAAAVLYWDAQPSEARDSNAIAPDPNLIAILPFSVQGVEDQAYFAEGMITLLGTTLDGIGPLYVVDDASIFEQLAQRGDSLVGPTAGSEIARAFGAGHFILGSVVRAGNENQLTARLYSDNGEQVNSATSSYSADSMLMSALDQLTRGLLPELLRDSDHTLTSLAASTSESIDALRYYVQAEADLRVGEAGNAFRAVNEALAIDSTFALAWYLRSRIRGWTELTDDFVRDAEKALRFSGNLPGRPLRLLTAWTHVGAGRHRQAERLYRALLAEYPNDVETIGSLADLFLHYRSSESDHREALQLFNRIAGLAPENVEYTIHVADAYALFARIDGRPGMLDSLALRWSGLESSDEAAPPVDWSAALASMNALQSRVMTIYARAAAMPGDSAAGYLRAGTGWDQTRALWYGYPDVALATGRRLGAPPVQMPLNPDIEWEALRAMGRFAEAGSPDPRLGADANPGPVSLVMNTLTATLPAFEISHDSLLALRNRVLDWDVVTDPLHPYGSESSVVRSYLLAQTSFALEDEDQFRQDVAQFRALNPDSVDHPVWRSVSAELRALEIWLAGNPGLAATTMRTAELTGVNFRNIDFFAWRHQPTWYLGELYELVDERAAAIEQFTSVVSRPVFAAPGWERAANLYEELGEQERAVRYLDLMIDFWRNADSDLQPRVRAAQIRRDRLIEARRSRTPPVSAVHYGNDAGPVIHDAQQLASRAVDSP